MIPAIDPFVQTQLEALIRERDAAVAALRLLVDLREIKQRMEVGKANVSEQAFYKHNQELAWLGAAAICERLSK